MSCWPGPTTSPSPPGATAPVVNWFTTVSSFATAPAVVTVRWDVADPQGTALTCTIDGDGNGTVDVTVPSCQGSGSRNVSLAAAGSYTAELVVSDGTESAQATTPITVTTGPSEPYDIVVRPVTPLDPGGQAQVHPAAQCRRAGASEAPRRSPRAAPRRSTSRSRRSTAPVASSAAPGRASPRATACPGWAG